MSNPKIVIGYCTGGSLVDDFHNSLLGFMAYDSASRRSLLGSIPQKGLYIDLNRNILAGKFMQTKGDYMLSLDDDVDFYQQIPYELLDEAEKNDRAIISAIYFSFIIDGKLRPVWFIHSPNNSERNAVANVGNFDVGPGKVSPLAAVGMGCCLIRRDVFEKIDQSEKYKDTAWPYYGREPIFVNGKIIPQGEDLSLCLRAEELGLQTWGHGGIEAGHWKRTRLDFRMFRALYELDLKEQGTY